MNLESCRSLNLWSQFFYFARKTQLCDRTVSIAMTLTMGVPPLAMTKGLIPTKVRKVSQDLYVTQISPFRLTIRNWLVSTGDSYNFRPFEPLPEHVISSFGSSAKWRLENSSEAPWKSSSQNWPTMQGANLGATKQSKFFADPELTEISMRLYVPLLENDPKGSPLTACSIRRDRWVLASWTPTVFIRGSSEVVNNDK